MLACAVRSEQECHAGAPLSLPMPPPTHTALLLCIGRANGNWTYLPKKSQTNKKINMSSSGRLGA